MATLPVLTHKATASIRRILKRKSKRRQSELIFIRRFLRRRGIHVVPPTDPIKLVNDDEVQVFGSHCFKGRPIYLDTIIQINETYAIGKIRNCGTCFAKRTTESVINYHCRLPPEKAGIGKLVLLEMTGEAKKAIKRSGGILRGAYGVTALFDETRRYYYLTVQVA